jgi:hypothetical protein
LKESNPVKITEYAVANKIAEEPAFAWWVQKVLRRRDPLIKKVKCQYWKKTHKFGILLPKLVAQALRIDQEMGTMFWKDTIQKEMQCVLSAFESNNGNKVPVVHIKIDCHMIFDI